MNYGLFDQSILSQSVGQVSLWEGGWRDQCVDKVVAYTKHALVKLFYPYQIIYIQDKLHSRRCKIYYSISFVNTFLVEVIYLPNSTTHLLNNHGQVLSGKQI